MSLRSISAEQAKALMDAGAVMIDIREADEHAREHIPHAQSQPVSTLPASLGTAGASQGIFHCRSGMRTSTHADRLASTVSCEAYMIEGGLDAWKKAGLPLRVDRKQPLEIMRQVQLAAGGLVVLGVVLGSAVSPWFYGIAGFVGAGLMFAGATGFCGMARALQYMPWNRRTAA